MMVFHTLWCIFLCSGYSVGVIALLQTQDLKRRGKRKTQAEALTARGCVDCKSTVNVGQCCCGLCTDDLCSEGICFNRQQPEERAEAGDVL